MRSKRILVALTVAFLLPFMVMAQAKVKTQHLVLEFVGGKGKSLTVTAPDSSILKLNVGIFEGDEIPVGSTIKTGPQTTAELSIKPNGTIVKLAADTTFTVKALGGTAGKANSFALVAGKVHAVAAKGGQYQVQTRTAVCGVRGTDFAVTATEDGKDSLIVKDGLVQFQKIDGQGNVLGDIMVGAGQFADAFADTFAAAPLTDEKAQEVFGDVEFEKLVPAQVGPADDGETAEASSASGSESSPDTEAAAKSSGAASENPFVTWMREALGAEIGSVTINDTTYAKAVLQPNLKFGKVKMGLYLPIIYSSNLFDPNDWYHPNGNDEWSFGFDKGWDANNWPSALADAAADLALKIRYFEYGTQLEDPFYIKVGNLKDMTVGHGLIMRNYANDTEFPSIRRVGLSLGYDSGKAGFEIMSNDLAIITTNPEIFGARVFSRPIDNFALAFGLSGVVDLHPGENLDAAARTDAGDPIFIGTGVDLDLPIIKTDALVLRAFSDAAVTLPYLRSGVGSYDGLAWELLWNNGNIRNWGAAAGFIGRAFFLDWRLEYRYYNGFFKPSFFDSTYDRMRSQYVLEYKNYLTDSSTYMSLPDVQAIYGEGSFSILNDKVVFTLGYAWPWLPGQSFETQINNTSDELHAKLAIKKGLIPIVDVAGSIFYDKRGIAKSIYNGDFSFLDANSYFGGEIDVPVPKTPAMDLAVIFATEPERDSNGNIMWKNEAAGIPYLKPSVSIETRIHL